MLKYESLDSTVQIIESIQLATDTLNCNLDLSISFDRKRVQPYTYLVFIYDEIQHSVKHFKLVITILQKNPTMVF